jgi:hypothetical protein
MPSFYCIIDDFLPADLAEKIESEFLDFNSEHYFGYNNAVEIKKQNK